jgi:hypothetical protein
MIKFYGGGRGIRTPARFDPPVGFQDRSLQPDLGIPPNKYAIDLKNLVAAEGIEPPTLRV